jgi:ABC-type phosphate transport system substrate-binding protein
MWARSRTGTIHAMVGFLNWMITQGQTMVQALDYAPLPKNVVQMEQTTIKQIH